MNLNKIAVIVTLCLLGGLLAFGVYVKREDNARENQYKEWQSERLELKVKTQELEKEIKELEEAYQMKISPKATTHLLFTDLNEGVYTKCYPEMEKRGYIGTLAVSTKQLPGSEGCMSIEQFKELQEKGWKVCVQWEKTNNTTRWWNGLKKDLQKLEISPEGVIYFPRGTYSANLDSRLKQMGFTIVISEKEDLESPLQKQYEDGIWHIGAIGSMTKQPKKWLKEAVAQDANIVFSTGFQLEYQEYNESSFARMLSVLEEYVATEELVVCDVQEAREHYRICAQGVGIETEEKYQNAKKELEEELKRIEQKLKEIDAEYQ